MSSLLPAVQKPCTCIFKNMQISPDKLQLYFKAALLMAEKSNTIQNVKVCILLIRAKK